VYTRAEVVNLVRKRRGGINIELDLTVITLPLDEMAFKVIKMY
jgi:hypothetical protein